MLRTCLYCQEPVKGRSDKKFCDDNCRNSYNNQLNSDSTNYVRNINNTLRKNRRILEDLNPEGKATKVLKSKLLMYGFDFNFHTNITTTKAGATYVFCYEHGYLALEQDFYLLVKRNETKE